MRAKLRPHGEGRNSIVVTKKVQDSQMDSKWQSISTGRAQKPLPSLERALLLLDLRPVQ